MALFGMTGEVSSTHSQTAFADELLSAIAPQILGLTGAARFALYMQADTMPALSFVNDGKQTLVYNGAHLFRPDAGSEYVVGKWHVWLLSAKPVVLIGLEGLPDRSPSPSGTVQVCGQMLLSAMERERRMGVDAAFFEAHPVPMVVWMGECAIAANCAARTLYGYDPAEMARLRMEHLLPPEAQDDLICLLEYRHARLLYDALRHRRKDGSYIDVEANFSEILWNGKPARMMVVHDVTERMAIGRKFLESEARSTRVQELSGVGVFEVDLVTGERFWSAELRRQVSYEPDQALPSDREMRMDHIMVEDRQAVALAYEAALRERRPCRVDYRVMRPDGRIVWIHEQSIIDYDHEGKPIRVLGTTVDITARKATEERLSWLAHHDTLTGLHNRTAIRELLGNTIAAACDQDESVAVLFIDIDGFKQVNDTMSHEVGDRLLVEIAHRIKSCAHDAKVIGRISGDEFVVGLLEPFELGHSFDAARLIVDVLSRPFDIADRLIYVSASVGISTLPTCGADVDTLIARADMAMYEAKRAGRRRVCVFEPAMLEQSLERMQIEDDMRLALERNEFVLRYQPIVSVANGRTVGVEALIRWLHPEGERSPAQFIPFAEDSEMIVHIGDWVLEEACQQGARWIAAGTPVSISVNVSSRQMADPHFVAKVRAAIAKAHFKAELLQVELTETVLIADLETSVKTIEKLREMGVRVAIDDFGTGYNSLANLRYCAIDTLKIDRSFIREIEHNPSDRAIAAAVLSAGKNLGIRVVAEGVETELCFEVLRDLGCDDAQGYWFGRPVDAEYVLIEDSESHEELLADQQV